MRGAYMLSKILKELRAKKDISQAELANNLGVAQQTVVDILPTSKAGGF